MSGKTADRDITRVNHLGQTVVIVPKGRPIPEGLPEASEGKKIEGPPENKAAARPRRKRAA